MIQSVTFIAVGFVFLMLGADWLVDGASTIARKYHIPEIVIGLTIVSIGTSMPELMVSVTSALSGHSDISIGNVIGSNLCNLLLILGITSVITPLEFNKNTIKYDIPIMIFSTILTFLLCNMCKSVSRLDGIILTIIFICFIKYTINLAKASSKCSCDINKSVSNKNIIISIFKVIIGIIVLKVGGGISVKNAVNVAHILGVSEKIIGVTIVAIGTSLPELVTSVVASIKGQVDIAIGNIVGSNIFNELLILGSSAIIKPIKYNVLYNFDFIILILSSLMLLCFSRKNKMTRINGITYLLMYLLYIFCLIM